MTLCVVQGSSGKPPRINRGWMREAASVVLALFLLAHATAAPAQVYKCLDGQGRATYQQQPCDAKSATQSTLSAPAPGVRKPEVRTPAPLPRPEPPATMSDRDLAILLMAKASCDKGLPGFTERVKGDYARFRMTMREQIERVEGNAQFQQSLKQQRLKEALDADRAPPSARDPEERKIVEALCYGNVHGSMGRKP